MNKQQAFSSFKNNQTMVSKLNHQFESLLLGHPHSIGWKAEKRSCDLVLLRRYKGKISGGFFGTLLLFDKGGRWDQCLYCLPLSSLLGVMPGATGNVLQPCGDCHEDLR